MQESQASKRSKALPGRKRLGTNGGRNLLIASAALATLHGASFASFTSAAHAYPPGHPGSSQPASEPDPEPEPDPDPSPGSSDNDRERDEQSAQARANAEQARQNEIELQEAQTPRTNTQTPNFNSDNDRQTTQPPKKQTEREQTEQEQSQPDREAQAKANAEQARQNEIELQEVQLSGQNPFERSGRDEPTGPVQQPPTPPPTIQADPFQFMNPNTPISLADALTLQKALADEELSPGEAAALFSAIDRADALDPNELTPEQQAARTAANIALADSYGIDTDEAWAEMGEVVMVPIEFLTPIGTGKDLADAVKTGNTGAAFLSAGLVVVELTPGKALVVAGKAGKAATTGHDLSKVADPPVAAIGPVGPPPTYIPPSTPIPDAPRPLEIPDRKPWDDPNPLLPDVDPKPKPSPKPATPKPGERTPVTDPEISPDVNPDTGNPHRNPKHDNPDDNPDSPDTPETPIDPDAPYQPDLPYDPAEPYTPGVDPYRPHHPNNPYNPNDPLDPDNPNSPLNPFSPNHPDHPANPSNPNSPNHPDHPDNPNRPSEPSFPEPVHPDFPFRPFNSNQTGAPTLGKVGAVTGAGATAAVVSLPLAAEQIPDTEQQEQQEQPSESFDEADRVNLERPDREVPTQDGPTQDGPTQRSIAASGSPHEVHFGDFDVFSVSDSDNDSDKPERTPALSAVTEPSDEQGNYRQKINPEPPTLRAQAFMVEPRYQSADPVADNAVADLETSPAMQQSRCVDEGSDGRLNWGVNPETNAGCWVSGTATKSDCVQHGHVWECPDGKQYAADDFPTA